MELSISFGSDILVQLSPSQRFAFEKWYNSWCT